jgi:peptidylprolyl isomerase
MKAVIIGVGVAAVAAGAYFFSPNKNLPTAETNAEVSPSDTTNSAETASNGTTAESAPQSAEVASADATASAAAPTELKSTDVKEGTGAVAQSGKTVVVHYTGTLTDGTKFDSSKDRNDPFSFQLGAGQVIKGWDVGVEGMKVGGIRTLVIPPEMGYGASGAGSIPPNSVLNFEVELLEVK